MQKRPLELTLLAFALAVNGALGLVNIFFLSRPPADLIWPLAAVYGFVHTFIAYALFSMWRYAPKVARPAIIAFFIGSFLLLQTLNQVLLTLNILVYLYSLFYIYRPDVRTAFGED